MLRKIHGLSSADGRGIPHISAQVLNFVYILRTQGLLRGRHDLATPVRLPSLRFASSVQPVTNGQTAASVISPLIDYLLSTDTPSSSLALLYEHLLLAINDIISGSNLGCNTNGLSAIPGWDPVVSQDLCLSLFDVD